MVHPKFRICRGVDRVMMIRLVLFVLAIGMMTTDVMAEKRTIVSLKEFVSTETRQAGFTLPSDMSLHVYARGGGISEGDSWDDTERMFAYGWIIDASTRNVVWKMSYDNSNHDGNFRVTDQYISLPRGSYEAYFCNYGYFVENPLSKTPMNVDRRRSADEYGHGHSHEGWRWFLRLFGADEASWRKKWENDARNYGLEIYAEGSDAGSIRTFTPPLGMKNVIVSITGVGDGTHEDKGFRLSRKAQVRIYAVGEGRHHDDMFDYGWIIDARSRERVWEMTSDRCVAAGGAKKNLKADETITLPAGDYIVSYVTDDSHSPADWNSPPPDDPLMYGITISVSEEAGKNIWSPLEVKENRDIIAQLVRIRDNQTVSAGFILKSDEPVRIYAIGERSNSEDHMADYAWIVNAVNRQRVWTMSEEHTYHAGGASKNRMVDEVVTLPKGKYLVYYTTDDSHAYGEWNDDPPTDPEHYGVTIYGKGEWFDPAKLDAVEPGSDALVRITRVGNDEDRSASFSLKTPARVRIYSVGEGVSGEMVDYGWIEDAHTGTIIWEMTYGMTRNAGGAKKNRLVNTTLLLDKGDYRVHFKTDGSHAYGEWNDDPPDDPDAWGISITREE